MAFHTRSRGALKMRSMRISRSVGLVIVALVAGSCSVVVVIVSPLYARGIPQAGLGGLPTSAGKPRSTRSRHRVGAGRAGSGLTGAFKPPSTSPITRASACFVPTSPMPLRAARRSSPPAVGLLVTLRPKDRSPAPPGKDADPQESLWDFKGRGRRQAAISGRSKGVETPGSGH